LESRSNKIKEGDSFLYSSVTALSSTLSYNYPPNNYGDCMLFDENDCIKYQVLTSKLLKVMYEIKQD
jgi:hypothetical protein